MYENANINIIEDQIHSLPIEQQLDLLKRMVQKLSDRIKVEQKTSSWMELYGIGKGLWKDEDPQEYVNRLREDRP